MPRQIPSTQGVGDRSCADRGGALLPWKTRANLSVRRSRLNTVDAPDEPLRSLQPARETRPHRQ